jgi:hypothetical protein
MGIRSDVGICLKHHAYTGLCLKSKKLIEECFGEPVDRHVDGLLFHTEGIKWYTSCDSGIMTFYKDLENFDDKDYLIIEACGEYPQSTEGCAGEWYDNPWNLYKSVSVELCWEH